MENNSGKGYRVWGQRPMILMVLCCLAFIGSLLLLFAREWRRLEAEYQGMISQSLSIHTHHDAAEFDRAIEDGIRAIYAADAILQAAEVENPGEVLAQRGWAHPEYSPVYPMAYLEGLDAQALSSLLGPNSAAALEQLRAGQPVVGGISHHQELGGYALTVVVPRVEREAVTGVISTLLLVDKLVSPKPDSAVYQDVQLCIIDEKGDLLYNTYNPSRMGNFFGDLAAHNLRPQDIDRIAQMVDSPGEDTAIFLRGGEAYFAASSHLAHNGWRLVALVRGPDVVLRSTNIFLDLVRTSTTAVLITIAVALFIFLLLLSNQRRLVAEQQRGNRLALRLQAMFDQHSALKVVIDPESRTIVDANASLCSYLGIPREELVGMRSEEFYTLPPEMISEQFHSVAAGRTTFFATPHRLRNGEIRYLDAFASPIHDGQRSLLYAILFDTTDREQYRNQLFREKELLRTTLQSIGDGVVTTDNCGNITGLNSVAEALTGWSSADAMGLPFSEVFILQNEETKLPVENPIQRVLDTGLVVGLANHTELISRQGEVIPIADSAAPIRREDGSAFGVVMVFRDVSGEKEHHRRVEYLSYHDSLTGLHNRRYLEERILQLELPHHLPLSVIMADVNGLKIINDVFGHQSGDSLLTSVANLLNRNCRPGDYVARWGGDEFVILMPNTPLVQAEQIAAYMRSAQVPIRGSNLHLSLSLGCACKETVGDSIENALQQAEKYMYRQKLLSGKSYRNVIINTLLVTLYEKSTETEEHSKRLESHCHLIGRELGLSSKELDELSLLALLHDIGKVGIAHHILQKPGPLSSTEWEEMRRHPEIGCRIAQETPELSVVADLILSHHERWDGRGYPRGLRGDAIPLACRILTVVDAFDAMTNDRVYRQAMPVPEALAELEENAGQQFDPEIAHLFVKLITEQGAPLAAGVLV